MSILQSIKEADGQLTGGARPGTKQAADLVRSRKANAFRFADDGLVPNHPSWPLVVYRGAVRLPDDFDPAAVLEELFGANGWGNSWRNGIYDYVHYHSRIHEVLGVARGTAKVRFGGKKGRTLELKAGDVAVLPAGTGHQCISASDDFLVVGAYPPSGTYDECTTTADHAKAVVTIPRVGRPRKDPVHGSKGPLLAAWTKG
ncbi:cupin domain-containing protein [Mesorhizobium sp. ES1-4]|uniref:cupin domain-containing protein n=1 Tax=Mesorhizobium sp. ES1-4 TaxID=2876627 RepID=UPI001CCB0157|nr:cupin domain-containing protein [Mesorhizobium sp. ES1-4]MBZ9797693.1 cupin domain-containing protein [Mesorhizobium sp. ES1-4]